MGFRVSHFRFLYFKRTRAKGHGSFFTFKQSSVFILGCVQGAIILINLSVGMCNFRRLFLLGELYEADFLKQGIYASK